MHCSGCPTTGVQLNQVMLRYPVASAAVSVMPVPTGKLAVVPMQVFEQLMPGGLDVIDPPAATFLVIDKEAPNTAVTLRA